MAVTVFVEHVSKMQKITIWLSWYLCKSQYIYKGSSKQHHYYSSLSLHLPCHHFLLLVTTLPFSLNHFQPNLNPLWTVQRNIMYWNELCLWFLQSCLVHLLLWLFLTGLALIAMCDPVDILIFFFPWKLSIEICCKVIAKKRRLQNH